MVVMMNASWQRESLIYTISPVFLLNMKLNAADQDNTRSEGILFRSPGVTIKHGRVATLSLDLFVLRPANRNMNSIVVQSNYSNFVKLKT